MRILTVKPNDAGQRLDKFLSKAVKGLPKSLMYKFIRTKKIKVNRARTEQNYILAEGDEIQLFIKDEFFSSPEKDNTSSTLASIRPKLSIVYEDANIMLLNKRPGVLVHEDTAGEDNTLVMHLKAYLYQSGEYSPDDEQSFAPALCNRIDRNTGGIVIAAKNAEALRVMNQKIKDGEVSKFYVCAVHGVPEPARGRLTNWLRKESATNTVAVYDAKRPDAKIAITDYRTLRVKGGDALLEIGLITGRTHQIRVQMAHMGHPLLGEGKYAVNRADKARGYKYQALYAYRVRFDFTDESGALGYLRGKQFSLPMEDIWFTADFN